MRASPRQTPDALISWHSRLLEKLGQRLVLGILFGKLVPGSVLLFTPPFFFFVMAAANIVRTVKFFFHPIVLFHKCDLSSRFPEHRPSS